MKEFNLPKRVMSPTEVNAIAFGLVTNPKVRELPPEAFDRLMESAERLAHRLASPAPTSPASGTDAPPTPGT
ncbi:hypothetical protein KKB40_03515 [Patescibacteria group bacterium]|nr:hypothetical protein [Patescibacteria group bacterium]